MIIHWSAGPLAVNLTARWSKTDKTCFSCFICPNPKDIPFTGRSGGKKEMK